MGVKQFVGTNENVLNCPMNNSWLYEDISVSWLTSDKLRVIEAVS